MAAAASKPHPAERPVERRRQTENKLDLLSAYFGAWPNAIIRGIKKQAKAPSQTDLWISDLFAGRGRHESETWPEGRRPGTAAIAGFRLWQTQNGATGLKLRTHLVAVDADPSFEQPLHASLDRFSKDHGGVVDVRISAGNCAAMLAGLRQQTVGAFSLWLFDPYGLDSIPFCLFEPLFDRRPYTEVLINLDAGAIVRLIDAAAKVQKTTQLSSLRQQTLDCLFGDRSWTGLPGTLTTTGDRERWLVDRYMSRLAPHFAYQAAYPLAGSQYLRYIVQLARSKTALDVFKQTYEQLAKPLKKKVVTRKDRARALAKALAGQTLTPREIVGLGLFTSSVALNEIESLCDHAFDLGLATRLPGPDGQTAFRPITEQAPPRLPLG
jgi:three-Cys-motif partner protein